MKIAVAMSGGVDSSTVVALLKQAGHEVIGLHMRLVCVAPSEAARVAEALGVRPEDLCCPQGHGCYVTHVAKSLGVPIEMVDFAAEREALIAYLCSEYDAGRTPNPCVVCNRWNKFGRLLRRGLALGAEAFATGHYVRLARRDGRLVVRRGADPAKEQSYVLFGLTQGQLARCLFPLGDLCKTEVRQMAAQLGVPAVEREESQDICFIPSRDYRRLLRERLGDRIQPGPILDTAGCVLGRHPGCQLFTIGQRQGLGVALGSPRYVVRIDRQANAVVIGTREELQRNTMRVSQVNWMAFAEPPARVEGTVQIRYNHQPAPATIEPTADSGARVTFHTPETGVSPGQAAVFYEDDIVLGGGWIDG
ncbi:MAG TPA: tRNA 2-thiouridine(34) synthase MnmA [Planctomycetota bacterium]|nr:tRNA 2-thiouridine(34) synthase MnmA [Planctomycetota bacterium]HRR82617.1 tRNA 2-thiouridine(34) synthase MnmA [Planctomycetota bacterium]HRT97079.1 tRNA 2-thiouridine(34) synthase MnmA [Planctomycetota bacterium]